MKSHVRTLVICMCTLCALAVWHNRTAFGMCGYIQKVVCPGCTPNIPADSTCFCGANGERCDCVKASGGIQSGSIRICEVGPFDYTPDPDGPGLGLDEPGTLCGTTEKCQKEEGGTLSCTEYVSGCQEPVLAPCDWYIYVQWTYNSLKEVGECAPD